ncbi:unnamed protein product [Nezara viridula]|uniref:Uncharacterized protein n=1 Tax=Nezara viridula TaxID=85310 RepID=A0A9P0HGU0_NEZVI|nr:unnamed protein product [Nezara viridula]
MATPPDRADQERAGPGRPLLAHLPGHHRPQAAHRDRGCQRRDLITAKRRARKIWQTNRLPSDKRTFDRLNNQIKLLIQQFNATNYDAYLKSL